MEKKNSLLIVDDENVNLTVLTHILKPEYDIYTATNGKDAIEKAKEKNPDLILLDIIMPEIDGYQTLSEIKKIEEIKKIPVIFITGLDSDEDEEKGLSMDAVDYITKPFSSSNVKLRVRNQIQLVRLHKELESAVRAAEAANHSKSVFLAKMSHEIRTPLNAILGISEIQLHKDTLADETRDAIKRIYNSGDLLLGIVNDILDTSKIEAGKLELVNAQYDLESMINDTLFLNVVKYENKPVNFILNIDENIPSAFIGDELRIKQILNNLLSNAFKYTAAGEVEFLITAEGKAEEAGNMVTLVFKVRDTGQGMTAEQVKKLFNEYARFNMEANNAIEGTGLGMSILQNLTRMMNGELIVESEPGKGSLFTVRLPQGSVDVPALGMETVQKLREFRSNYETKVKKMQIVRAPVFSGRVLIVDDIDINLYVTTEMLLPYGLQVDTAISGADAIDKVKQNDYNLIFMDHIMPIMDGVETAQEIRKLGAKYEELPIVALTANTVAGMKEKFLSNGFNGFLSKPLSMHELNEVLKEWMPK